MLKTSVMALLLAFSKFTFALCGEPIDIDNRLELFVGDHLIDETKGYVPQQLASTRLESCRIHDRRA